MSEHEVTKHHLHCEVVKAFHRFISSARTGPDTNVPQTHKINADTPRAELC